MLARGAEAVIYLEKREDSKVVVKERIEKGYRIKELDNLLRKRRTKREVKLMTEARKFGVDVPKIVEVDWKNHKIVMEYVEGRKLKEIIGSDGKICEEIGRIVGRLHSAGIIHGDLTTSNMILSRGRVFLIDFGLGFFSKRIEDQGVDLKLMKDALNSTHPDIFEECWEKVVEGYKKEYKDSEKVLKKVEEIEKRGRYVRRHGKS